LKNPPKPAAQAAPVEPLAMLTRLGLGPESLLMNDPKLFVDGRFLASLLVELEDELGRDETPLALFQIGLLHGFRDAARVCRSHDEKRLPNAIDEIADTTSLLMHWSAGARAHDSGELWIGGCWPERHEAVARCSRLGVASDPACWLSAGYTTGWLSGTLDRALIAREIECAATGAETCRFEVLETHAWQHRSDPEIHRILAHVPFEAFRKLAVSPPVARGAQPAVGAADDAGFDRSQAVVHIWGPVMVLPFTTLDEALGTVDLLGRDPGISEIRAVIIDLRERPLDEGFGAAALEQILETIESWNAQSLVTGICPDSEAAMASIEASHLILRKDLSEAIATAFQIADAQRHLL
jgi:predicted hydrocarbon binding protein